MMKNDNPAIMYVDRLEIKRILALLILLIPFSILSQMDTSYVEEEDTIYHEVPNPSEYFKINKGNSYTYLKNGGDFDTTILKTIADDIRKGGMFMTNRDVNVNINSFALDRRNEVLYVNKVHNSTHTVISDYIGNSRAEESISLFCYYMTDSLKHDFVLRIFDEVESCACSKSAFDEIVNSKEIAEAIVNPNLKWMTFSYFQHYNKDGFLDEYIFVEYKIRWRLIGRSYTLILDNKE